MAGEQPRSLCYYAQKQADRFKTDTVKTYISDAIKHGFAVIDVNLPKYITEDDVSNHPSPRAQAQTH